MPDQEDEAELARRRRAAAKEGLLERAERLEAVLARSPELRVLFDPWIDLQVQAEAKVRSAIRDYVELGDDVMARRLEKDLERPTKPGAEPKWGKTLNPGFVFEAMKAAIIAQPAPNVSAAAEAVATLEPGAVTANAVRHVWNEIAQKQGLKGKELAHRVWQDARTRDEPPA